MTASVACTVIMIIFNRFCLCLVAVLMSVPMATAIAQEAVTEKAVKANEELTPETTPTEATQAVATPTPEKKETPAQAKPEKGIQEMSEEEKAAAGLDKLSPGELEYLDEWMRNYKKGAEKKAAEKATEVAKAETSKQGSETVKRAFLKDKDFALVSRVNGEMVALSGRTVVTLEDGTRWKQANKGDRYRPRATDHPAAAVFHTQFGYKMRIEGMPDFYVDPVRE